MSAPPEERLTADVLVIGSGPGGCVAANELARAGRSVLMVEEGDYLALSATQHFSYDEMLRKYRGAGIGVAHGATPLSWVEGCCVGGGSEVNRGLYHRAPDAVIERWRRDFRVAALASEDLAAHYEACEAIAQVQFLPGEAPRCSRLLAEGAREKGWAVSEAPRLFDYGANGGRGRKQSMTETFLERYLAAGGRLLANARIDRVRRSNGEWVASGLLKAPGKGRSAIEIRAARVVAACGAVQTPALLRRSGLRHNIGNSLRFHPMLKIVAEFDRDVREAGEHDPVHQIREFEPLLGMGCSVAHPPLLGLALAPHQGHWEMVAERAARMAIFYVQSAGGVARIRTLPGFSEPIVRIAFEQHEIETLKKGIALLCEAIFAAGAVRVYPSVDRCDPIASPDAIGPMVSGLQLGAGALTSVHAFCSCPMGEANDRTAADSFGKVHGTDGLYIADASLLCTPTVVNPQATVMAVAHRNAAEMLARDFR